MLVVRILEIVLIVLVLRAVIKMAIAMMRNRASKKNIPEAKRFDAQGHDIVDGDYKELK